jgi:hypothetical protein
MQAWDQPEVIIDIESLARNWREGGMAAVPLQVSSEVVKEKSPGLSDAFLPQNTSRGNICRQLCLRFFFDIMEYVYL